MHYIKYFGYYDTPDNGDENRGYSLAATTKMKYICSVLNNIGYSVELVSLSVTNNKKFYSGKVVDINDSLKLRLFPTFPWGNRIQKMLSIISLNVLLFVYMIINLSKDEEVIIYHSLKYSRLIHLAKFIKRFKIILEVEEVYQDVVTCSSALRLKEFKAFEYADKFIFPTGMLNQRVNKRFKPYAVVHGTYESIIDYNSNFKDDKIHVVYAGTFDFEKGVLNAIDSAMYLNEDYHVHIIGFGSKSTIDEIKKRIEHFSSTSKATISYDGLLTGEDYFKFIQQCHIGLSTQPLEAEYNNSSFPSKILSYMSNGLRVVTVRLKCIENSSLDQYMYYYNTEDSSEIAKTIMAVDITSDYDSRKMLKNLDIEFTEKLEKLLDN